MSHVSLDKYQKRKLRTKDKHDRIKTMVNEKYSIERKRIDDVEQEVADFWAMSVETVRKILRTA